MEILRNKIEKLTERIDEAENLREESLDMIKDLEEQINENELYSEDLRRHCKSTKQRIGEVQAKILQGEKQARIYERRIEENEVILTRLEQESNEKEDACIRTEELMSKAKMDHMTLSGAYEDARSRKQLLLKEIEKVSNLTNVNLQQVYTYFIDMP